jgi:hypothetical protein
LFPKPENYCAPKESGLFFRRVFEFLAALLGHPRVIQTLESSSERVSRDAQLLQDVRKIAERALEECPAK